MIRICFVCLGNICRSPMAEFIMKEQVKKRGLVDEFLIESRATSYEEEGNDMYPPAKKMLEEKNIPYTKHIARRLEKEDYSKYDFFICMEDSNVQRAVSILGSQDKVRKLLNRDIADPWYTGEFLTTYQDLYEGINLFLEQYKSSR